MVRRTIGTSILLICWIVAAMAQQPPAPSPEPAHQVYVLTGCLAGSAATSSFKLTGASAVGQAPPRRASSPSAATTSDEYVLEPVSSIGEQGISRERLQAHAGARVEVTVRPVGVLPSAPSSVSTDSKDKPGETAPPRYTVIKINRLADSCG